MLFYLVLLFIPAIYSQNECAARCSRLHVRSLARVGFDREKVTSLFEKQRPLGTMKDVCWRISDHLDCMRRCPKDKEHDKFARNARFKCNFVLKDMEQHLSCVSRYHSFIEVKCSTFLKESVRLRQTLSPDTTPDREACRYLHLNSLCLENSVNQYCPKAKKIFRRLNFRDYFLNFILPLDDVVFDDVDLDSCQIFDFVKTAGGNSEKEIDEELTTIINRWEDDVTSTRPSIGPPRITPKNRKEASEFSSLLSDLMTSSESSTERIPSSDGEVTSSESMESTGYSADQTTPTPTTSIEKYDGSPKKMENYGQTTELPHPSLSTLLLSTSTSSFYSDVTSASIHTEQGDIVHIGTAELSTKTIHDDYSTETSMELTSFRPTISSTEMTSSSEVTYPPNTVTRKVFSDDSMESEPPNFGYSSMRARYPTTHRDMDIVTPVTLDSRAIFGFETETTEDNQEATTKPMYNGRTSSAESRRHETTTDSSTFTSRSDEESRSSEVSSSSSKGPAQKATPPFGPMTSQTHDTVDSTVTSGELEDSTVPFDSPRMTSFTEEIVEMAGNSQMPNESGRTTPSFNIVSPPDEVTSSKNRMTSRGRTRPTATKHATRTPPSPVEKSTVTSLPGVTTPLLRGGVIIKPILRWDQREPESDTKSSTGLRSATEETENFDESVDEQPADDVYDAIGDGVYDDVTNQNSEVILDSGDDVGSHMMGDLLSTNTPSSEIEMSGDRSMHSNDKQTLLFIYLLLFGLAFASLVCMLLACIWCRKSATYEITKY